MIAVKHSDSRVRRSYLSALRDSQALSLLVWYLYASSTSPVYFYWLFENRKPFTSQGLSGFLWWADAAWK